MIQADMAADNFTRAKIIATIGPASEQSPVLTDLIERGVSVVRLNFSHGTYERHQKVINTVRAFNKRQGRRYLCLLQDLQGPKVRIGDIAGGAVTIKKGKELVITAHNVLGTAEKVGTTYTQLIEDVALGDRILIDDGKIILKAIRKKGTDLITEIIHGGCLQSKKGINLPYTKLSIPSLTPKDKQDLYFGLQNNVEWVALSFIRQAQDIIDLKAIIQKMGKAAKVIAKIEKPEALANIDEIIAVTDAVMVARGDLGVEIAMERIPMVQKAIVAKCNKVGKPVIIATQMMESMLENPYPTRAETTDITNAVIDGADALMLSGETATGKYPCEVVTKMKKTILVAEQLAAIYNKYQEVVPHSLTFYNDSLIQHVCRLSNEIHAKVIVCMTKSGWAAFALAKHRPKAPIFVFTNDHMLLNTISLIWGVRGIYYDGMESTDHTFADITKILTQKEYLKKGDIFISTASMPIHERQRTNMLKINIVS